MLISWIIEWYIFKKIIQWRQENTGLIKRHKIQSLDGIKSNPRVVTAHSQVFSVYFLRHFVPMMNMCINSISFTSNLMISSFYYSKSISILYTYLNTFLITIIPFICFTPILNPNQDYTYKCIQQENLFHIKTYYAHNKNIINKIKVKPGMHWASHKQRSNLVRQFHHSTFW